MWLTSVEDQLFFVTELVEGIVDLSAETAPFCAEGIQNVF